MALQASVAVRNAMLDAFEPVLGASAYMEIRSGAVPATTATADAGTLLATIALPADPFAAASGGVKAKQGSWVSAPAVASGTAGHYRIKDGSNVVHLQGTCSQRGADGGTGDVRLDQATAAVVAGQILTAASYSISQSGA